MVDLVSATTADIARSIGAALLTLAATALLVLAHRGLDLPAAVDTLTAALAFGSTLATGFYAVEAVVAFMARGPRKSRA